jgi:hypothetical protein
VAATDAKVIGKKSAAARTRLPSPEKCGNTVRTVADDSHMYSVVIRLK